MINNRKISGKTFISGPFAVTDIHNGGTIFGIIYYQYLAFVSETEVKMTNKVTFNRGMKNSQESKEEEHWIGHYQMDSDNKHIECSLSYLNGTKKLYIDYVADKILLGESYLNESLDGTSMVFSEV